MVVYQNRVFKNDDIVYVEEISDGEEMRCLCRIIDTCGEGVVAHRFWFLTLEALDGSAFYNVTIDNIYKNND